jgi:hypothetical protein
MIIGTGIIMIGHGIGIETIGMIDIPMMVIHMNRTRKSLTSLEQDICPASIAISSRGFHVRMFGMSGADKDFQSYLVGQAVRKDQVDFKIIKTVTRSSARQDKIAIDAMG